MSTLYEYPKKWKQCKNIDCKSHVVHSDTVAMQRKINGCQWLSLNEVAKCNNYKGGD